VPRHSRPKKGGKILAGYCGRPNFAGRRNFANGGFMTKSVQEHNRSVLEEMRMEGPTVKRARFLSGKVLQMEHAIFVAQANLEGMQRELVAEARRLRDLISEASRKGECGWSQPVLIHWRDVGCPTILEAVGGA
jgi:hypothetical protein